jgi:hypothetical protein
MKKPGLTVFLLEVIAAGLRYLGELALDIAAGIDAGVWEFRRARHAAQSGIVASGSRPSW